MSGGIPSSSGWTPSTTSFASVPSVRKLRQALESDDLADVGNNAETLRRSLTVFLDQATTLPVKRWAKTHWQSFAFLTVRNRLAGSPFRALLRDPRVKACDVLQAKLEALERKVAVSGPGWFDFLRVGGLTVQRIRRGPSVVQTGSADVSFREEREATYRELSRLRARLRPHPIEPSAPFAPGFVDLPRRRYYYVLSLPSDEELLPFSRPFSALSFEERQELRRAPEVPELALEDLPEPEFGEGDEDWDDGTEEQEDEEDGRPFDPFDPECQAVRTELNKESPHHPKSTVEARHDLMELDRNSTQTYSRLRREDVDEVRVMVATLEEREMEHDFEQDLCPVDSEHTWNHWKSTDWNGRIRAPRDGVLLMRTRWCVLRDSDAGNASFQADLLPDMDLVALATRRRIYPTGLCRPELLRALCFGAREGRRSREQTCFEKFRDAHAATELAMRRTLDLYEIQIRKIDDATSFPSLDEATAAAEELFFSMNAETLDKERVPRRRKTQK